MKAWRNGDELILLDGHTRIRLEILQTTLRHLHSSGHIAPDEIQQMFRTIMGESTHD